MCIKYHSTEHVISGCVTHVTVINDNLFDKLSFVATFCTATDIQTTEGDELDINRERERETVLKITLFRRVVSRGGTGYSRAYEPGTSI